ncbi:MAG: tetratricopeptide repeat protein [Pseudomonadota bacterium]
MREPAVPGDPLGAARAAFAAGDWPAALAAAQAAVERLPGSVDALVLAVNSALRCDALARAVPWLEALLRAHPGHPQFTRMLSTAHNNLGARQQRAGDATAALGSFDHALAAWPDNTDALFNRAKLALAAGQTTTALPDLRRLSALAPRDVPVGVLLAETEIADDIADPPLRAREALARLAATPGIDRLRLAFAQADTGDGAGALDAVLALSDLTQAGNAGALAHRLAECSDAARARRAFDHLAGLAGRGREAPGLQWAIGARLALPRVYRDLAELETHRAGFAAGLDALDAEYDAVALARCAPRLEQLQWANFLLAYQGHNDAPLMHRFGTFTGRCLDAFAPPLRAPMPPRRPGAPRIGFLSSAFRHSTVGSYFASWVATAKSRGWRVEVFQLGPTFDDFTTRIGRDCDHLHRLDAPLDAIAGMVRGRELDLLVFPDLGADARVNVLGALRLARRQAMAWGQPTTSGSDRIDCFIGCAGMEPPDARAHYVEPDLRWLPGIGTHYAAPVPPARRSRAELGLPAGRLHLVPQSPFKIHPDTDAMLGTIAAADPDSVVLLFGSERPRSAALLRERLGRALRAAGADPDRQLRFLPLVPRQRFLEVCAVCDVMVDTPHWSGGNTTIDALLSGLPVITVPGALMRGRQSTAMLRALGLDELVCPDAAAQAATALAVAGDPARRVELARRIAAGLPDLLAGGGAMNVLGDHFAALLTEAGADPS